MTIIDDTAGFTITRLRRTAWLTMQPIKPSRRETLLTAIAKARQWVDDLAQGRTATFAQIGRREGKVERHRGASIFKMMVR
jgi:hypothetical protein